MQVRSVTALDYVMHDELLAQLKERAFRVDLQGDVRYAVLLPPGFPFERTVRVPRHANLRLALGLEPAVEHPVRVSVTAEVGGQAITLLEETLAPCQVDQPCRWSERTVPPRRCPGR
jgi:hypothetical protein